jgi:RNA polymerase sigma factor (sigma-70 family)
VFLAGTFPDIAAEKEGSDSMTTIDMTDEQLIKMVAQNDAIAFEEFDRRWRKLLVAFISRKVRNVLDAEDLAQTVLVKVWQRSSTYNAASGKVATWIKQMAANAIIDQLRHAKRAKRGGGLVQADFPQESLLAPEKRDSHYDEEFIRAIMDSMPVAERRCIRAIMENQSINDMVTSTELRRSQVVSLRTAAIARMRHCICSRDSGVDTIAITPNSKKRQVQQTLF